MSIETDSTRIEAGLEVVIADEVYIARDGDILGREGTVAPKFFSMIPTVSRQHAIIHKDKGNWYIEVPESVANVTKLDGVEVVRGKRHLLLGEHILKMSDKCVIKLRV